MEIIEFENVATKERAFAYLRERDMHVIRTSAEEIGIPPTGLDRMVMTNLGSLVMLELEGFTFTYVTEDELKKRNKKTWEAYMTFKAVCPDYFAKSSYQPD